MIEAVNPLRPGIFIVTCCWWRHLWVKKDILYVYETPSMIMLTVNWGEMPMTLRKLEVL